MMLETVTDYQTIADLEGDLLSDAEDLTGLLFAQCDKILRACSPATYTRLGFKTAEDVKAFIGGVLKIGRASIHKRLKVARAIPPEDRIADLGFEVHVVAAGQSDPLHWLSVAASQNLTAEQLHAAIKEARGDKPAPEDLVYVTRAAFGVVMGWDGDRTLTIRLDSAPKYDPIVSATCTMTLVQSVGERTQPVDFAPVEVSEAA